MLCARLAESIGIPVPIKAVVPSSITLEAKHINNSDGEYCCDIIVLILLKFPLNVLALFYLLEIDDPEDHTPIPSYRHQ